MEPGGDIGFYKFMPVGAMGRKQRGIAVITLFIKIIARPLVHARGSREAMDEEDCLIIILMCFDDASGIWMEAVFFMRDEVLDLFSVEEEVNII